MSQGRKLSFLPVGQGITGRGDGSQKAAWSNAVLLDDECEDMFNSEQNKFPVTLLHSNTNNSPHVPKKELDLLDTTAHRKKSYPHTYAPLKPGRVVRRRFLAFSPGEEPASSSSARKGSSPERPYMIEPPALTSMEKEGYRITPDSDTQISDPASDIPGIPNDSTPEKRVQFGEDDNFPEHIEKLPKSTRRISAPHTRKFSLQEEPQWRREGRRVSVQPEDAVLPEADLEDLDSHRSDDPRAFRRSKIRKMSTGSPHVNINRKDGNTKLKELLSTNFKKIYDHRPHSLFVQLDELVDAGEEKEWRQTARWIKYEEDIEEGSDRWGRPHVASLSFHSLLNLRRCIQSGVLLLDLNEKDLAGVAFRIAEQMAIDELIEEKDKPGVMRCLLLRHRHVNEHDRSFRLSLKKNSSYSSLQWLWTNERLAGRRSTLATIPGLTPSSVMPGGRPRLSGPPITARRHTTQMINLSDGERGKTQTIQMSHIDGEDGLKNWSPTSPDDVKIDLKEETYASQEDVKKSGDDSILKRIPEGSEATSVLVGTVNFLNNPTIAFVRLAHGIYMPSITEITIPVRFMFVLLGPSTADLDYHEVGRSISTLMSNRSFYEIAYKADHRKDFLSAINEFLDDSIVLPPGNWDSQALLPFDELKSKSDMIQRRKKDALEKRLLSSDNDKDNVEKSMLISDDRKPYKMPPPDPLDKTGKPFGGFINDIKRRFPFYLSDFTDGLNGQCFAASIFMYFAALSSAITFGGLIADKTGNLIGISETLISTAITGVLFALLSGQPMMIVGTTGPLLLFDESLFNLCSSNGIDYLTLRLYLGLWLAVIGSVVALFEGSVLVKKFTRFTEDIFSSLISLIFIIESLSKMKFVYYKHPLLSTYCEAAVAALASLNFFSTGITSTPFPFFDEFNMTTTEYDETTLYNETNPSNFTLSGPENLLKPDYIVEIDSQPNTALFSTLLTLGTFAIAYYLRIFRNSKFLGRNIRRALGDFGVPIAIVIMVMLDYFVPQTYTEKLSVPEGLTPSDPESRGWIIPFSGSDNNEFPIWVAFAASVPALMVYIIIFMETHIAELIVDKPERNLRKGSGFHMDIVIISFLNILCGLIGAPFVCVATVRSVSHVSALTVMSRTHAPGDKPYITEVKEQRLSGLVVAILVGLSVLMAPLLSLVPLAVLFGIFLYMGISSINGIQLFERIILFFMPVKHYPPAAYVKKVPTMKMHLFTFIQMSCLILLWVVKSSEASLAFPFLLIMMVPLRSQLTRIFTPRELRALDGKQQDLDDDEPDFYRESTLPG